MKVFLGLAYTHGYRPLLDRKLVSEHVTVVSKPEQADVVIGMNNDYGQPPERVVLVMLEPPAGWTIRLYEKWEKFRRVFYWNTDSWVPSNVRQYTVSPLYWPLPALHHIGLHRVNTAMRSRRVYFSGGVRACMAPFGRVNLYPVRRKIVNGLRKNGIDVVAHGVGFGGSTVDLHSLMDIRRGKMREITECDPDFVMQIENSQMTNYITEKIHDGIISDRVMLYLGSPNIEEHVPTECFVDLREWFDPSDGSIDSAGVARYIKFMRQAKYDKILSAAREWRESFWDKEEDSFDWAIHEMTKTVLREIGVVA